MTNGNIRRRTRRAAADTAIAAAEVAPSNQLCNTLQLEIRYVDPATLKPPARLLRKNSGRQRNAIEASIRAFGFLNPILVDGTERIVCGHARWLAAKEIGLNEVPVVRSMHLTAEQLRLYALAENRCGELGEWDEAGLKIEFAELSDLTFQTDLNLELSGFSTSEIDLVLGALEPEQASGGDPEEPSAEPVTRLGDLWQLGVHRLFCGNALEEESYLTLMGEERAQMIFADAPFNLSATTISGLGKVKHGNFAMASGEMSRAEFTTFLTTAFGLMAKYSCDGSIHFQCMDWRHIREMLDAGEEVYSELKNLVVWDKQKGGMGTFYRSQQELLFVWKHGAARHINTFGLGETGRYRTNVWQYPGNNGFHHNRQKELKTHATIKPLPLVADAIRDCSHHGGIILDAFGGAGTTLLAAEHTGRQARLLELEPRYCDSTIHAWQERTGREAVLVASGQTWAETALARGIDPVTGPDADDNQIDSEEDFGHSGDDSEEDA